MAALSSYPLPRPGGRLCKPHLQPAIRNILVLGAFLLSAPFARSVLMTPLSIEEMSRTADVVLRGVVTSKSCRRDSAGRIYTRVDLQVLDLWKGRVAENPLCVLHGGGVLGDRVSSVSGQVNYEIGEEVVAFLIINRRGEAVTLGLAQGKFSVWEERGEKLARNPFHGNFNPSESRDRLHASREAAPAELTLEQLRTRVRGAVR
jgi:hypothetical protein